MARRLTPSFETYICRSTTQCCLAQEESSECLLEWTHPAGKKQAVIWFSKHNAQYLDSTCVIIYSSVSAGGCYIGLVLSCVCGGIQNSINRAVTTGSVIYRQFTPFYTQTFLFMSLRQYFPSVTITHIDFSMTGMWCGDDNSYPPCPQVADRGTCLQI